MTQQLEQAEIAALLSRLPKIEPSYEKTDSVIPADYTYRVSISIGKKYYVWIQYDENGDAIFFLELNKEKKVSVVSRESLSGNANMLPFSKGTALYGTMYEHPNGRRVFLMEDIHYYCGIPVAKETFERKLGRMAHVVEKMGSAFEIWFRLPHITCINNNSENTNKKASGYVEHHAQYRASNRLAPYVNLSTVPVQGVQEDEAVKYMECARPLMCDYTKPQFKQPTVFVVKPAVQFDIYNLYCQGPEPTVPRRYIPLVSRADQQCANAHITSGDKSCQVNTNKLVFCGVAGIQTYNTSVLLNTLFRKVLANRNLDAIEESDDEDMFENVCETKWVPDMTKEVKMVCEFNQKVRKWIPVRVAADTDAVITSDKLRMK